INRSIGGHRHTQQVSRLAVQEQRPLAVASALPELAVGSRGRVQTALSVGGKVPDVLNLGVGFRRGMAGAGYLNDLPAGPGAHEHLAFGRGGPALDRVWRA